MNKVFELTYTQSIHRGRSVETTEITACYVRTLAEAEAWKAADPRNSYSAATLDDDDMWQCAN